MPTKKITHSFLSYKLVHKDKIISLLNLKDLKIVIFLFLGSLDYYSNTQYCIFDRIACINLNMNTWPAAYTII